MNKIFNILITIIIISSTSPSWASSYAAFVKVFPFVDRIPTNSIFIIDYPEYYYKFKEEIKDMNFYATTSKGKTIKLDPIDIRYSGNMGQIYLKPRKGFSLNDSIQLKVVFSKKLKIDPFRHNAFIGRLGDRKWKICMDEDKMAPKFLEEKITYKIKYYEYSPGEGYSIIFNCPIKDNSYESLSQIKFNQKKYPIAYEIQFNDSKYVYFMGDSNFLIYQSIDSNFNFEFNKEYSLSVRAMDSAGNFLMKLKPLYLIQKWIINMA